MMETKEMIATTFTIDDGTYYPGHYDPTDRWNGWANPYFTLTTIEEIVDDVNEFYEDYDGWDMHITVDELETGSLLIQTREYDDITVEMLHPRMIDGEPHFAFMGYDWTWSEKK